MDLEHGIEALDNLEGMRRHCEGVLSDLAGGGFIRRIRSAVVERELAGIRNRLGKLKLELAEACDREIEASGVPAVSLTDTMALAKRLSGLSVRAAVVASACRSWRGDEATALVKEYAKEFDGLSLSTRVRIIEAIDETDPAEDDSDTVRMSAFMRNYMSRHDIKDVAAKLDQLSRVLEGMMQSELDFAWKVRRQIVALEMPQPSPTLVEAVGRITGTRVATGAAPSM